MMGIYPDEVKIDEEYWKDFYLMAFKIELRKGMIYSFLTDEQVEEALIMMENKNILAVNF